MENESNLSEKKFDGLQCLCCEKHLRNRFFSYREKDVKEFIKNLKEELSAKNYPHHVRFCKQIVIKIDKLAGQYLI